MTAYPTMCLSCWMLFVFQGALAMGPGMNNICDMKCPDMKWDPLCASDNTTYINDCYFAKAIVCQGRHDLTQGHRGKCNCVHEQCPDVHDPVCGSDGHTYDNHCYLRVARTCSPGADIQRAHPGPCDPNPADPLCHSHRTCRHIYMPVCGSDKRTYGNECELGRMNDCRSVENRVEVAHDGECNTHNTLPDPCARGSGGGGCLTIYDPVCGSDGRTYTNWRHIQQENNKRLDPQKVDIVYMGACQGSPYVRHCRPQTQCSSTLKLQCGSDGNTYRNPCELFKENECRDPERWVWFRHDGACTRSSASPGKKLLESLVAGTIIAVGVFLVALIVLRCVQRQRTSLLYVAYHVQPTADELNDACVNTVDTNARGRRGVNIV